MKYSLRSLMIVVLVGPPALAFGYFAFTPPLLGNNDVSLVVSLACFLVVFGVAPWFILRRAP